MKVINLTPHDIHVYEGIRKIGSYPRTGKFARAEVKTSAAGNLDGVPVVKVTYGDVVDLPDPEPFTVFIVSQITAQAVKSMGDDRNDLFITHDAVRNDDGQIIGCRGFAKL